jgi:hypothetical protein
MSEFMLRLHRFFFQRSMSFFEFVAIVQLTTFASHYDNYWLLLLLIPVWMLQQHEQDKLEK